MIVSYSLGWLKPYELPWLAYPPEIAKSFAPELAALAGYRAHRPNLGTHEGRCPSHLLTGEPAGLGAVDALRPEQEELIALYRAGAISVDGTGWFHKAGGQRSQLVRFLRETSSTRPCGCAGVNAAPRR